jgi:hypothetical protein
MLLPWLRKLTKRNSARRVRGRGEGPDKSRVRPFLEVLETRLAPSIAVGANINISRLPFNQNEATIAMDPTNPLNLFAASNDESLAPAGIFGAFSHDGGVTWAREFIGTGVNAPLACCDPKAVFDQFGNLFLVYFSLSSGAVLLQSSDGGFTFNVASIFTTAADQPQVSVGAGEIWVSFLDSTGFIGTAGAFDRGLGIANIGAFTKVQDLEGSSFTNFGDLAIGPSGQVVVDYQTIMSTPFNEVLVNINPTGLTGSFFLPIAGTFSNAFVATSVSMTMPYLGDPAQSNDHGVRLRAAVDFDRSGGPFNGRLYLDYLDNPNSLTVPSNTNVYVRHSDDNGLTWSAPVRVNDDFGNATASHFLPTMVVDQATGLVAVQWYDTRNDPGFGPGDTDGVPNTDAELFVSASADGGATWMKNAQVAAKPSNSRDSEPPFSPILRNLGYGDFMKNTAFFNGTMYAIWTDNSNSTGDNPDGTLKKLDDYTAKILINATPGPTPINIVLGPTSPTTTGGPISIVLGSNGTGTTTSSDVNSFITTLRGSLGSGSRIAAAVTGDFSGSGSADVAGLDPATGQWWVSTSNGQSSVWGSWAPNAHWTNVMVGDFNGDGKADVVGRDASTGQWWVSLSTGGSFVTAPWGTWSTGATWADMRIGDFTGDGKADIAGRWLQGGQWWIAQSTGSGFNSSLWASWSTAVSWVDVQVADFNHDGMADITARALQSGQWWTSLSTGSGFSTSLWASWAPWVNWTNVQVGDFNGDGLPDIVGRDPSSGMWWVGQSTGSGFSTIPWAVWSTGVTWVDVQVGDFNGDGKADITARAQQTGQWWTTASTGTSYTTSLWAVWSTAVTWVDVQTTSLTGMDGFVGMAAQTGQWWMATPAVSTTSPAPASGTQSNTLGSTPTTTATSNTGPISTVLGSH